MAKQTDRSVEKEQYYHGLLPREDIETMLVKNGDFVLRMSEPKKGEPRSYVLSVMHNAQIDDPLVAIKHFVIKNVGVKFTINDEHKLSSIQLLIEFHRKQKGSLMADVVLVRPIMRQVWELDHESVTIQKKLGEGAFGEVSMGVLRMKKDGKLVKVAVKQAKLEKLTKEQIKEFMGEARVLRSLSHPNVVRFFGVAAGQEPLYMVMELASNGSLDSYLKKNTDLPMEKYNEMVLQAAWGVEYLHERTLIHRDIAARNCLYGDGLVKISDFGLSRTGLVYKMSENRIVPIRWLAVETLATSVYTPKTDVWAYGVLCWEVFNSGADPYPDMTVTEVNSQVRGGYRMEMPANINPDVARMVTERCWAENPNDRFSMAEIAQFLQRVFGISRADPNQGQENRAAVIMNQSTPARSVAGKKMRNRGSKKQKVSRNSKFLPASGQ